MAGLSPEHKNVPLGRIVITRAALLALQQDDVRKAVRRHQRGDWGECSKEDAEANNVSLREGSRILSVFRDRNDKKFWIITEADRSVTTVLLPEDY